MPGLMRTSNPALNEKAFGGQAGVGEAMTLQGTVNKTGVLLLCVVATAAWTWGLAHSNTPDAAYPWMIGGAIGGFLVALVTIFKPQVAAISAPIYALLEGLLLGGFSAYLEKSYHGIAAQAVGLTFATAAAMLIVYKSGLIRVTEHFRIGVIAATGGIALFYFVSMLLRIFTHSQNSLIWGSGIFGILFSLFVVAVAALNLVLDFDIIERGVQNGAPKFMEWYGAFGLMVTLIWLYIELMRLLTKVNRR